MTTSRAPVTARRDARWAFLLAAALPLGVAGTACASPVPTLHPGGSDPPPDTLTVDFPVRLAPSLLSLRSCAPLWLGAPDAATQDTVSVLRRAPPAAPRTPIAPAGAASDAVVFSGTKSLSVDVGRGRSATMQQSLDLTLRGKIGGDVEVAALLSDQNLPFEPDGTSREIDDLDRLSISIRAPRGEATMGDFVLSGLPGQYGNIMRHLQGVRGTAVAGGARWNVAAAGAKGEKQTIELHGEEGRQGPYPLVSRGLASGSVGVVAGSEAVWLDGIRLKRGSDADYVIDYGVGTVTFTVRHPITAQSRIAVDFEEAAGDYRRSFYAATTQGPIRGAGTWFANYMKEGDDAKNPVSGALTPEDRQALSAMGDSAATTTPSGVRYVGPGAGAYAWDQSDPAHPHWVYLGAGHGDYDVAFASVGTGKGAYADTTASDGTAFFVYRGENLGTYAPGHPLAVPSSKMLVDLGGTAHVLGSVAVDGEIARSGYDRNLLSTRNDGDNQGMAARFAARLDPRAITIGGARLGTLRASALVRSQDDRFEPFDRVDPTFEGERWNQREGSAGEGRQELALQYDPRPGLSVTADLGRRTVTGSQSIRNGAQAVLTGAVGGSLYWDEARNSSEGVNGRRERWGLDLARTQGIVLPRFAVHDEWIQGAEGDSVDSRQSRDVSLGLQLVPAPSIRVRGGYGFRTDAVVAIAGDAAAVQSASTLEGGVSAHSGTSLSLDAGFTHRRVEGTAAPQGSDLAQLALLAGRPGAPVTSELRYDVTQLREPALVRQFVPVGTGNGSYDPFGNAKWGGGYELVSSVGDPETHSRAVVQLRVDAYPGRAVSPARGAAPIWRGFGASTYLRVETLSTLSLGDFSHVASPGDYLAPGTTLEGTMTARQTFQFAPPGRRYDLTAELGYRREQNGEYQDLLTAREAVDGRFGVRHSLPARMRLQGSLTADRGVQTVRRLDMGEQAQALTRGHGMELELSKQLGSAWSASLLGQERRSVDLTHGGVLDFVSAGPTAHCAAGAKLRLDGRVLWGRSGVSGLYQPPGLYVAAIPGNRLDYDFLGEYRLRERISLSLGLNGADTPRTPAFYTGHFELKGSF